VREVLTRKFNGMMRALFRQKGANMDISILSSDEAQSFISEHTAVLDQSMDTAPMSDLMRQRLSRSNYIFSGMKTFHELNEAFPSMLDENGNRKPFERFLNDVRNIDETYNGNYLRAEYNFVHASAAMAGKWEQFQQDGDRYYLQYRTQHDDKVRPEHAALDGVTLPISDPFWESYYPPNGWNCRCTVTQVRKSKYPATSHSEAMDRGREALESDKHDIFRFNSGRQQKSVPDYNPYTIRRCNDCDVAGGKINLAYTPDSDQCAACRLIHECAGNRERTARAIERTHYVKKEMAPLLARRVTKTIGEGKSINVRFTTGGNLHLYSDTLHRSHILQLEDLKNVADIMEGATFVSDAPREEGHSNPYEHFYYFEATLHGRRIRLNVGKEKKERRGGKYSIKYILYSINDVRT
jgi:SPP1 gp7 family putative phage head morphogenesis protein